MAKLVATLIFLSVVVGCKARSEVVTQGPPVLPSDCGGVLDDAQLRSIAWYMVNAPEKQIPEWVHCADTFDIGIDSNCRGLFDAMTGLGWTPPDGPLEGDICRED